ncbi:AAA family ATPase [Saccharopolyspora indica]|uniref:ATP-binding protein n=1 Tax=Saccharopolyspora indica TaxID=1229659 RepID=UPI0022EACE95|nr:AAA family ATPase [Saccharopolyspora indica]MDA3645724.1 AAA family ATPase [Saccharopolyspora indica]
MASTGLIGRDHPAKALRGEVDRTLDSHGGLVLVTGEAGIGKTTLAADAADHAKREGATTFSSACWDGEGAPGYWPWVQVVRHLRRNTPEPVWAEATSNAGSALAALLGDARNDDARSAPHSPFQLYDAVTTLLVTASRHRPLVVVLEDLHWADAASIKLLGFVAQHAWFENLLVIGTYRDVEIEFADPQLESLMRPLVSRATTIALDGLNRDEVAALVTRTTGRTADPDLIAEIHQRTGGNPFFVEQTARLWQSGNPVTAAPPSVRAALQQRLSLLPEEVVELMTTATVLGREFHLELVAKAADTSIGQVERLLEVAVRARLMQWLDADLLTFTHDLVRELLYHAIDDDQRRQRHATVVRALTSSRALAAQVLPSDLARHAYLATPLLEPAEAVEHLLAAARVASGKLALEEAVGHYRRALELVPAGDRRRWAIIGLDLGTAQYYADDVAGGQQTFEDVVAIARELDDGELLARAALTLHGLSHPTRKQQLEIDLINEAHRKLLSESTRAGGQRPRYAAARNQSAFDRAAQELSAHTAVLARQGMDDEALGRSLLARHDAILGPGTAAERLSIIDEMRAVAQRTADRELGLHASQLRIGALLEQGDPRCLDELNAFAAEADRTGLARFFFESCWIRATFATMTGRFDDARSLIERAANLDEQPFVNSSRVGRHLRWACELRQGRFAEVDTLLAQLTDDDHPVLRLIKATSAVQMGDLESALRHLTEITARSETYHGWFAPLWLRFQAQTAAASRDPELCERAREAIAPYRDQWAVTAGATVDGPMVFWSASLDAAQQRWDDAVAGFRTARQAADRLRARPWSLEARARLAEVLLARGSTGDAAEADQLLSDVRAEATELGMAYLAEQAANLGPVGPAPVAVPAGTAFRFDGEVWTLSYHGTTVHLPDAKGLRDLHVLLGRPGTEVPAVQLLNPAGGEIVVSARSLGGDAVLDKEAKLQYRRRLAQLDEEIDRAVDLGDDERAAALDTERQALLDELRAAAGLAGRPRRLGDEAERARKAVTNRIRDTLRRLDQRHPALAEHLRASVSTGATCRYQPSTEIDWAL